MKRYWLYQLTERFCDYETSSVLCLETDTDVMPSDEMLHVIAREERGSDETEYDESLGAYWFDGFIVKLPVMLRELTQQEAIVWRQAKDLALAQPNISAQKHTFLYCPKCDSPVNIYIDITASWDWKHSDYVSDHGGGEKGHCAICGAGPFEPVEREIDFSFFSDLELDPVHDNGVDIERVDTSSDQISYWTIYGRYRPTDEHVGCNALFDFTDKATAEIFCRQLCEYFGFDPAC